MPLLESEAGVIAYFDNAPVSAGAPTVMLLHSSAASGQQWRRLVGCLTPQFRVITPDLIGYGHTPMTAHAPTMADEIALLLALSRQIDGRFHLIGHSYGGAVALELARALPERIASLALYEPAVFGLLRQSGEQAAWAEIAAIARRHILLVEKGDLAGAAVGFLDYWIGKGALMAMPLQTRMYIVSRMRKVAEEWRTIFSAQAGGYEAGDYAALTMPILLMRGEASTLAARKAADLLGRRLPAPRRQSLPGLAHMAPLIQPDRINPLLADFLAAAAALRRRIPMPQPVA